MLNSLNLIAAGIAVLACILLMAQTSVASDHRTYANVSFYFSPHEDDWQLFMNPPAFNDVARDDTKVVFVHVTAGDAGAGTGSAGRKYPYYRARENGSITSIRFMADAGKLPQTERTSAVTLNGHKIYREAYGNTVAYFLRIPDGSGEGEGYKRTGFQSLKRLAEGKITKLSAIDGSATYSSWDDLVATIRALYDHERNSAPAVQIHVPELDEATNPGDHSDHRHTARAALEAADHLPCARRFHYREYVISGFPENMTSEEKEQQLAVFGAMVAGILAFDHESEWAPHYRAFLGRRYYRVEDPAADCRK